MNVGRYLCRSGEHSGPVGGGIVCIEPQQKVCADFSCPFSTLSSLGKKDAVNQALYLSSLFSFVVLFVPSISFSILLSYPRLSSSSPELTSSCPQAGLPSCLPVLQFILSSCPQAHLSSFSSSSCLSFILPFCPQAIVSSCPPVLHIRYSIILSSICLSTHLLSSSGHFSFSPQVHFFVSSWSFNSPLILSSCPQTHLSSCPSAASLPSYHPVQDLSK